MYINEHIKQTHFINKTYDMVLKINSLILILFFTMCSYKKYEIEPGNDPNFTVVENSQKDFKKFNKKVIVFGIPIYASKKVDNSKLLHAANILAQYLDNDEDGIVDNKLVVEQMILHKAALVMWNNRLDLLGLSEFDYIQDLGADETVPEWHTDRSERFDASIEEIWHLITHVGYSNAYPDVFGENEGTTISNAMDIARGGHFTTIPNRYPNNAWFTYDDKTCEYNCMVTEYIYWAMSSILGAQENRLNEISQEWKLNTRALVQNTDTLIYSLLTDSQYKFPTVLPDGKYKQ